MPKNIHIRGTCGLCGRTVFYSNHEPTKKGQIYSALGIAEYKISQICEHCFDEIADDTEDE